MDSNSDLTLYLCPNHLIPSDQPGICPRCDREMVGCRPGDPDDPCRRPMMDQHGRILTRAPLWWLHYSVAELTQRFQDKE